MFTAIVILNWGKKYRKSFKDIHKAEKWLDEMRQLYRPGLLTSMYITEKKSK